MIPQHLTHVEREGDVIVASCTCGWSEVVKGAGAKKPTLKHARFVAWSHWAAHPVASAESPESSPLD